MNNNKKYNYLFKNTIVFSISSFGSKILTFLLVPLYTSVLSTDEYGNADLISTTASLVVFLTTLCIYDAVMRYAIDHVKQQEAILGNGLLIVIKGSSVFFIALAIFSFFNPIHWPKYFYLFLFIKVFFDGLYQVTSKYLQGIDKITKVAIAGILVTFTTVISNIILLLIVRAGLIGYLVSLCLSSAVGFIYCLFYCGNLKEIISSGLHDKSLMKEMVAYSTPLIYNGIAWWMNASIDKYFIVAIKGAAENGIYSVSQKIPSILSGFTSIFLQAWGLSAIREYDKNDTDGFFSKTYDVFNAGLVFISSFLILVNIPLAKVLFAKEFFVGWNYSSILVFSTLFNSLSGFVGSVFSAVKNNKIYAISTVAAAGVNVVLNALFIPMIGVTGAAIATVISFVVVWAIRLIYSRKYIAYRINYLRDFICYGLIMVQILFERMNGHFYVGQICVVIILIMLNRNAAKILLGKFREMVATKISTK